MVRFFGQMFPHSTVIGDSAVGNFQSRLNSLIIYTERWYSDKKSDNKFRYERVHLCF